MKYLGLFVTLGIVLSIAFTGVSNYISAVNYGNTTETEIVYRHENLKNILGQYTLKVGEVAQVPEMYKDDMKEVVTAAISGRYGKDGSKAVFQWLKEDNSPAKLDASMYTRIQTIIEAGRDRYTNEQTMFLDTKRVYQTNLGYFWKGFWLKLAGYPKINLAEYKIVMASDTQEKFDTGVDNGIQLRKKN